MKKPKKLLSLLLSISLVFASVGMYSPTASAESLSSLKDRQSAIRSKIDANEEKLKKLKSEKSAQEKIVNELNVQLSNLSDEYDNVRAQKYVVDKDIFDTQAKIQKLVEEIQQKDAEIDRTVELFCNRLHASYVSGNTTTLDMLLNSSSVSVFLNRLELLKRVTNNDQKLVDQLNKEIAALDKAKADLEAEKSKLEIKQQELKGVENQIQSTLNSIKAKTQEVEAKLREINSQATETSEDIESFNEQEQQIQAAINKIYAETKRKQQQAANSSAPQYVNPGKPSSGFMFPITYGSAYMSSGFGYRSASISGNAFHGGIDIAGGGIYGQPIYASRAGTVIVAEKYSDRGYGRYVMIDHGDGYQTLYGHCSSVVVSVGQYVKQGQLISHVGSSGNSTGPHLHFEVRYHNQKVNPLNYVSLR